MYVRTYVPTLLSGCYIASADLDLSTDLYKITEYRGSVSLSKASAACIIMYTLIKRVTKYLAVYLS